MAKALFIVYYEDEPSNNEIERDAPEIDPKTKSHNQKENLLDRKEVANLCKVKSLSTLHYWNKQGLLKPTHKAGRKPLYRYEDV